MGVHPKAVHHLVPSQDAEDLGGMEGPIDKVAADGVVGIAVITAVIEIHDAHRRVISVIPWRRTGQVAPLGIDQLVQGDQGHLGSRSRPKIKIIGTVDGAAGILGHHVVDLARRQRGGGDRHRVPPRNKGGRGGAGLVNPIGLATSIIPLNSDLVGRAYSGDIAPNPYSNGRLIAGSRESDGYAERGRLEGVSGERVVVVILVTVIALAGGCGYRRDGNGKRRGIGWGIGGGPGW